MVAVVVVDMVEEDIVAAVEVAVAEVSLSLPFPLFHR
jgi:hypothetical protein